MIFIYVDNSPDSHNHLIIDTSQMIAAYGEHNGTMKISLREGKTYTLSQTATIAFLDFIMKHHGKDQISFNAASCAIEEE